jgi:enoyl-CoA hydratase
MSQAHYRQEGDVAVIALDNPPVNGLGSALRAGIVAGVQRALADPAVKAIVVTGAGKVFSGGADIREFNTPKMFDEPGLSAVIATIESAGKPVVAAIAGFALGGGNELALGCHYRVGSPGAQIGLPEVNLGLLPGAGGTQRLPRFIGKAKAMDLCLTGRMMDAAEAERAGLVSRIVPADRLLEEALAVGQRISELSQPIAMMVKESVNRAFETPLAEGVRFERRLFHSTFATEDQKEGMAAFIEKRKPAFRHR